MLDPIVPMEPKSSEQIPTGTDWAAQIKWDGVHVLTYRDSQGVRLFNRKLRERTLHYPEITEAVPAFCNADSVILDGEIIAFGADGKPSFHEVMRRDGLRRMDRVEKMRQVVPVTYMIYDLVYLNGEWLNRKPWQERIDLLAQVVTPQSGIQLVTSHEDGQALFTVIKQHGMEGIVMKKKNSPYLIGEKKDVWLKIKNYRDLIAVIGGFTQKGGIVNAVLLGLYDETGRLWYVGHSGTGKLSNRDWVDLTNRLRPLIVADRPFANKPERQADAVWVQPEVCVKIQFAEWTEGRSLRQPSIQAFVDLPARDCVFEESQ